MLPRSLRLHDGAEFATAVRGGRRAGGRLVVVHHATTEDGATRVGFVVSRAVGGAVVRNQVKRRLRHLVAQRRGDLPPGLLVVRAQPDAARSDVGELGEALDRCLSRLGGTALHHEPGKHAPEREGT